ncbi:hypothetical protein [Winogradskyella sp. 3972H.M.0a.05]|uniref:hypothetical protein n=1 Tax=Winogradskyella sp. 3972H.M.0a.05 TaxID=2950277 RepID=UPI00339B3F6B
MRWIVFVLLCFSRFGLAQDSIQSTLIKSDQFKVDQIVSIDNFNTLYYTSDNLSFNKKSDTQTVDYSNIQLGRITSADAFNTLKINLFYKDFNTVIILDNRLAEVFKIDFNITQPYKNVSLVSTGYDNTIWIFNQDLQQLELYDYKANITRVSSLPIQDNILAIESDYNYCWLLTDKHLYVYNYFGSLITKYENQGYTNLRIDSGNIFLQRENHLYILPKNSDDIKPVKLPELLISQFLVTNETLYIYDDEMLHQFQLKID